MNQKNKKQEPEKQILAWKFSDEPEKQETRTKQD